MKHDSLSNILCKRFTTAVARVAGLKPEEIDPLLRPAGDAKFGDYQCNVAMSLARPLKAKPREIAERIVAEVQPKLGDLAEPLEIAGPGFINIRLKTEFLAQYLGEIPAPPAEHDSPAKVSQDRRGLSPVENPHKVVIDYSQPNIAKQMHVGHLRSTVIGDVIARVLAFAGHEVIRQNHIGDWGTQFGILIRYYREHALPTLETHDDVLEAMATDYKQANEQFNTDSQFAADARRAVGELQSGDPEARHLWEQMCQVSRAGFTEIYDRLGVLLDPSDVCGESFYNDMLAPVVAELRQKLPPREAPPAPGQPWAEVREDGGAVCVFMYDADGQPRFKKPDGEILPLIIQKSDGAFLYATTDLAAIRYRLQKLRARRVIYVTDVRQKLHFEMFLAAARTAGWIADDVQVEHVTFGTVMGADRKPLKTREGTPIPLRELIDEAEKRAYALLKERVQDSEPEAPARDQSRPAAKIPHPNTKAEKHEIARRVGIAALKYADLRSDRTSDYVFGWDRLLAMQGNTAPYMMYAYARIRSIYRKAAEQFDSPDVYTPAVRLTLSESPERVLALHLARLRETIDTVATDLEPHILCTYLYDLATEFMRFYEACPVLRAPDEATRLSRMRLCDLTARTLKLGLGLLGIETIERM